LQEIVSENDNMKDNAELAYLRYEKRLDKLNENTTDIVERLNQRVSELDGESKRIKAVLFDAKLQYKSNEITEEIYQQISLNTNDLLDHINLEKSEIKNIMNKFTQQTLENTVTSTSSTTEASLPSSETKETSFNNQQDENNATLIENNQIITTNTSIIHHPDDLNKGVNQSQEIQEEKEIEDSVAVISDTANTNESERTEINPMIASTSSSS
jgi:hypothetical protein